MEHKMFLTPAPLEKIKNKQKTLELRLYDEKRQKLNIGDTIIFISTEDEKITLRVKVLGLETFESFDELYRNVDLLECGYTESDVAEASPEDMLEYYSKERQEKYGVVAIKVSV